MKFIQFKTATALAAVAFAAVSMPAAASTINLSAVSGENVNTSVQDVNQAAAALNANIGSVVDSVVDVSATAANNVASMEINTTQDASFGNLSLVDASNVNASLDVVNQQALAGNLSGALRNTALDVSGTVANNVATITIETGQD